MNGKRTLVTGVFGLTAAISLAVFTVTTRVGAITSDEIHIDKKVERAKPLTSLPLFFDSLRVYCPLDAQIGVLNPPPGWSLFINPRFPFKFVTVTETEKKVDVICSYGPPEISGGWSIVQALSANYSCQVPNSYPATYVDCTSKPPPRRRRP